MRDVRRDESDSGIFKERGSGRCKERESGVRDLRREDSGSGICKERGELDC